MSEQVAAIETLLADAEEAHSVYESTQLNGAYDAEWPRWYAAYAVEHGIGDLLGRALGADELAEFLVAGWERRQAADTPATEPWGASTAREIAAHF